MLVRSQPSPPSAVPGSEEKPPADHGLNPFLKEKGKGTVWNGFFLRGEKRMIIRLLLTRAWIRFVVHQLACLLSVHGGETAVFIKVVLEQGRGFAHLWVGQNGRLISISCKAMGMA